MLAKQINENGNKHDAKYPKSFGVISLVQNVEYCTQIRGFKSLQAKKS